MAWILSTLRQRMLQNILSIDNHPPSRSCPASMGLRRQVSTGERKETYPCGSVDLWQWGSMPRRSSRRQVWRWRMQSKVSALVVYYYPWLRLVWAGVIGDSECWIQRIIATTSLTSRLGSNELMIEAGCSRQQACRAGVKQKQRKIFYVSPVTTTEPAPSCLTDRRTVTVDGQSAVRRSARPEVRRSAVRASPRRSVGRCGGRSSVGRRAGARSVGER